MDVGESGSVKSELAKVFECGNDINGLIDIIQRFPFPFELDEVGRKFNGEIGLDNVILKIRGAAGRKMETRRTTGNVTLGGGAVAAGDGDCVRDGRENDEPIFD